MSPAREAALRALSSCRYGDRWSDETFLRTAEQYALSPLDRALCARLCRGVLQNRTLLDAVLSSFSTLRPDRMEEKVLGILRLGVYQLLFLEKIPVHAAVSESVALTRKYAKNPRAPGFVNGVLRALSRAKEGGDLPDFSAFPLHVRTSHPEWLVNEICLTYGEEAEAALLANNEVPPLCVQTNTLRTTTDELLARLSEEGVSAQKHPHIPDCLILSGTGDLTGLSSFAQGLFYVQDAAARLAVIGAAPTPGMRVLDCCAAPGGKSFGCAIAMEGRGEILSRDLSEKKIPLIVSGAERLGFSCIRAEAHDARLFEEALADSFDLVLADLPCSGLGVIRRKPDIRYKDPEPLAGLPALQREILDTVCRYVRPGGRLFYSTCTVLRRENEEVVAGFLAAHPEFSPAPFSLPEPYPQGEDGMVSLAPHRDGTDGFFLSGLVRRA